MRYLEGVILLIDHFSWYYKLICEHRKIQWDKQNICNRTSELYTLHIFAVVNFDRVFGYIMSHLIKSARNDGHQSEWTLMYITYSTLNF